MRAPNVSRLTLEPTEINDLVNNREAPILSLLLLLLLSLSILSKELLPAYQVGQNASNVLNGKIMLSQIVFK